MAGKKAEMKIFDRWIEGRFSLSKQPDSIFIQWKFTYKSEEEEGYHVRRGFTSKEDAITNAKHHGVYLGRES